MMSTVKLPGSVRFDSQIKIHTGTKKDDVSLAKEFKEHLEKDHCKDGAINQGRLKNDLWKENEQTDITYSG